MDELNKKIEKAEESALRYLSYGMHTEEQVAKRLAEKGFTGAEYEGVIGKVTEHLKEAGYINDMEYAVSYIEYAKGKGHAEYRIRRVLSERGINRDMMEDAFYAYEKRMYEEGNEVISDPERARIEALKVFTAGTSDEKAAARAGRRLSSLGYRSCDIYEAIEYIKNMKKEE